MARHEWAGGSGGMRAEVSEGLADEGPAEVGPRREIGPALPFDKADTDEEGEECWWDEE